MHDFLQYLVVSAGFELLGFVLKYLLIGVILYIILFVILPAYIQHILLKDFLIALEEVVKKLNESAYKQDVANVNLGNIQINLGNIHSQLQYQSGILANIDRRTHYRKIRGAPLD